jgi:hemolysin activation/secretion protein
MLEFLKFERCAGAEMRRVGAAFSCAIGFAGTAIAQTASQITPQSFRPPLESPAGGLTVSAPQELATPAGAEALFVTLSGVTVEGGFEALQGAAAALQTRLSQRRISGAEIFAAARELEAAYASAGYVLVRVVLPPQTLVDGARLKLVVIDGFIERIETKDAPERVRARIAAVLAPLQGRGGLTLAEIERRVLLAGDAPGVILHSTLAPGEKPGATILIVDGKHEPVGGLVTVDNSLAAPLGQWTTGLGLDLNSVSGFGELVYLRANGDPNFGSNGFLNPDARNRALAAGVVLPIGDDGLSFNLEGTEARTNPIPTAGFARADVFQRVSARVRYPWVRARSLNLNTEISFDAAQEQESLLLSGASAPLALDRVRVMRLTADGGWEAPWGGVFSGRFTASFGLDGLGARSAAAASAILPLSRQYADASFDKVEVSLAYAQGLVDHLTVSVYARGQTSFGQALVQSEQIGIATPTGLSSFNVGTLQGDSGVTLRGELASPWSLPLFAETFAAVASPYVFGAIGEVFLENPTSVEEPSLRAACYGLGLRLSGAENGGFANASLGFEWGRQAQSGGIPGLATQRGDRLMLMAALRL